MRIEQLQAMFPDYYEFGTKDKNNLNFKHARYPMSITATEFLAIQSIVKRYEPKRGFEVATGTGVSGEEFLQFCRRNFATCPRVLENCGHPGPGFNLAIIDKMGG